ncbi:hypothetical protein LCGC14_1348120 [marine sediment metagenome]|uniref:Uncharacterized protein n=1 Tax=marine sediment metagenome TaxID=412755 RepID=A0A0F9KBQ4_9ZZZZ
MAKAEIISFPDKLPMYIWICNECTGNQMIIEVDKSGDKVLEIWCANCGETITDINNPKGGSNAKG